MLRCILLITGLAAAPLSAQSVQDWAQIMNLRPSPAVQNSVMTRGAAGDGVWQVQKLDHGQGQLHGDCFGFSISHLPSAGGKDMLPQDLLHWVRVHLSDFINPEIGSCSVKGFEDQWRWESKLPGSAVVYFDIKAPMAFRGCQVVSEASPMHWVFSTVRASGEGMKAWPVSGNRWFALVGQQKSLNFYTRGVYRLPAAPADAAAGAATIAAEQAFWRDWMGRVEGFVKSRGGKTSAINGITPGIVAQDWDSLRGSLYSPAIKWVDPEGTWISDDPKARFRVVVKPGMMECDLIERTAAGTELLRTLPLHPGGAEGWRLERPNSDNEVLTFAGFSEATIKLIQTAKPGPSILRFQRKGNQLKAKWQGLSVSLDGKGGVAAIQEPSTSKSREYSFNSAP